MRRFSCPVCANELHFDNSACLSCRSLVAYDAGGEAFVTLPETPGPSDPVPCANRDIAACNWIAAADADGYCDACRHNRTIPDLDVPGNAGHWADLEVAKRFLFYSLLRWRLPHPTREEAGEAGLAFDFLSDTVDAEGKPKPVLTGHASGIITLNIAEADDAERVARRESLGEPYRTLIGHMRHEVGHYYWDRLIRDGGRLDGFRALFGDEREDYAEALKRNYSDGPPVDWRDRHISTYAASHPWEDWAETWAHYIHIVDASETARAFGLRLHGETDGDDSDPYTQTGFDEIMADWVPLTVAVNSLNRSMGQPDLYPFVLSDPVVEKLHYIHRVIRGEG